MQKKGASLGTMVAKVSIQAVKAFWALHLGEQKLLV